MKRQSPCPTQGSDTLYVSVKTDLPDNYASWSVLYNKIDKPLDQVQNPFLNRHVINNKNTVTITRSDLFKILKDLGFIPKKSTFTTETQDQP